MSETASNDPTDLVPEDDVQPVLAEAVTRRGFRWPATVRSFELPAFRLLFASNVLFFMAQFVFLACQQWTVLTLTSSRTAVGAVGFAQGLGVLLISPVAGVWTDRLSRRTILLRARLLLVLVTFAMGALAAFGLVAIWQVLLGSLVLGIMIGISQPATQTFVFDVVRSERVANAMALNSAGNGIAQMSGPALAGLVIAGIGVSAGYATSSGAYLVAALLLLAITVLNARPLGARGPFWHEFQAGFREVVSNGVARWIMFLVGSTLFASAIIAMRPVLAKQVFNVGPLGFGTMGAFFGVGVICGALVAANLSTRVKNKAWIVLIAGLVYYGAEVLYGLAPTFRLVLPCELLLGMSGTVVGSYMFPLAQLAVRREVQGRAVSIIYALQPLMFVGQLFAGVLADHIGPRWTLALFGAAAMAMYVFAIAKGTLVRSAATVEFG